MLKVRVDSRMELGVYRVLQVDMELGAITCSCGGITTLTETEQMCSHIDAVVVVGETAMVHAEDWDLARVLHEQFGHHITLPKTWRRTWIDDLNWRA